MAKSKKKSKRQKKLEAAVEAVWGRPRIYDDPVAFEHDCRLYFATLMYDAPTIEGICLHLGMSRDTWERYRKQKGFKEVCEKAEMKMSAGWQTFLSKAGRSDGAKFWLTNKKSDEFKIRGVGDSPDNPMHVKEVITGMRISKDKEK